MTYRYNPYDKTANPTLHGLVANAQMSRALGGPPKCPISAILLDQPTAHTSSAAPSPSRVTGHPEGIIGLFLLPAFVPFIYAGYKTYDLLTGPFALPGWAGWIGGIGAFIVSFIVVGKLLDALVPRWAARLVVPAYRRCALHRGAAFHGQPVVAVWLRGARPFVRLCPV